MGTCNYCGKIHSDICKKNPAYRDADEEVTFPDGSLIGEDE